MGRRPSKYKQKHIEYLEGLLKTFRHRHFTLNHLKEQLEKKYLELQPVGQSSLALIMKKHFGWSFKKAKKIAAPALTSDVLLLKQ